MSIRSKVFPASVDRANMPRSPHTKMAFGSTRMLRRPVPGATGKGSKVSPRSLDTKHMFMPRPPQT
jgi:hypothetical protein